MGQTDPFSPPRPLDAAQSIGPALRYTWAMLTRPFSLRKWLGLALITLVAGMFGGGVNLRLPGGRWSGSPAPGDLRAYAEVLADWVQEHVALLVGVALLLVLLTVAGTWLAAVFRFVFLDSVVRNRAAAKRAFAENWDRGLALFLWQFGFGALAMVLLGSAAALIVLPLLLAARADHPGAAGSLLALPAALSLAVGFALLLAEGVAFALIQVTLMDFVLPVMYLEELGIWSAWRRVIGLVSTQAGSFLLYYVIKIPVGIGCALAGGMLGAAGAIAAVVPVGMLALIGFGVALAAHVSWAWTPVTIFVTVFGVGVVALYLVYAGSCASLPVPVFRQAWALWFLGERDPRLAALGFPPGPYVRNGPAPGHTERV